MGALRDFRSTPQQGKLRFPCKMMVSIFIRVLAVMTTGCIPFSFVNSDDFFGCPCNSPSAENSKADSSSDSRDEKTEKNGSSSPRTLGQSLKAYCHCLHTHGETLNEKKEPSSKENGKVDGESASQEKKNNNKKNKKES